MSTPAIRRLIADAPLPALPIEDGWYHDVARCQTRPTSRVDRAILQASFSHFIELEEHPGGPALGQSVRGGAPHLPRGWAMPAAWEPLRFHLQLNLDDLAPHDPFGRLPRAGMLYVFLHPAENACAVHYDPAPRELVIRGDLAALHDATALRFAPAFTFLAGDGNPYEYLWIRESIPADLRTALEQELGCAMATWVEPRRLFGWPRYWHGEDERSARDEAGSVVEPPARPFLWLHDALDDAAVHFWIEPAALTRADFRAVAVTSSGT